MVADITADGHLVLVVGYHSHICENIGINVKLIHIIKQHKIDNQFACRF